MQGVGVKRVADEEGDGGEKGGEKSVVHVCV